MKSLLKVRFGMYWAIVAIEYDKAFRLIWETIINGENIR